MKRKLLFTALIGLAMFALSGCGGSGSNGLNGAITLSAHVEGTTVVGTATYTNPTKTDLIGTEITISTNKTDIFGGPLTFSTNNSGSVSFIFGPASGKNLNGTETFTVTATTGNLQDFQPNLTMTGRTITINPPANQTIAVALLDLATTKSIILDTTPFATITDPVGGVINNQTINIETVVSSTAGSGPNLVFPTTALTDPNGVASLTGATLTLNTPAPGETATVTITWTVKQTVTGPDAVLAASGTTTITLIRAAS